MIRYGQFGLFLSSLFKIFVFLNDSEKNPLRIAPYCALPRALRSTFENMRAQYGVRLSEVCRVSTAAIFTFSIFQGYFAHDISTFQISYKFISSNKFEVQVQPNPYLQPSAPSLDFPWSKSLRGRRQQRWAPRSAGRTATRSARRTGSATSTRTK